MKVLVITNLYPPIVIGGYEICCQEIVNYLKECGDEVCVLTSYYDFNRPQKEGDVLRYLRHQGNPSTRGFNAWPKSLFPHKEKNTLKSIVRDFKPELVYIFNLSGLSSQILPEIIRLNIPKVFEFGDDWLIRKSQKVKDLLNSLENPPKKFWLKSFKKIIYGLAKNRLEIDINHLKGCRQIFVSSHLQNEYTHHGITEVKQSDVIHNGLHLDQFKNIENNKELEDNTINLLFVGQVNVNKGVHLILEAMSQLNTSSNRVKYQCHIVGDIKDASYKGRLDDFIKQNDLQDQVKFYGYLPREKLVNIYSTSDIFVFPSLYENEGFGLTNIEAMACQLPVISTFVGGAKEYLKNGENCLVFDPNDTSSLATKIQQLANDKSLREQLGANGHRLVKDQFNLELLLDKKRQVLVEVCK